MIFEGPTQTILSFYEPHTEWALHVLLQLLVLATAHIKSDQHTSQLSYDVVTPMISKKKKQVLKKCK